MAYHTVEHLEVVIVGAGQVGLVTGYFLKDTGLSYALYETHPRIGDSWRHRYDSLVLFSTRAYSTLPGLPLPGDAEGYPSKDEMADYLERYAQTFHLPVRTAEGIACLERAAPHFVAQTTRGQVVEAAAVIVATGAFQQPIVPAFAGKLAPDVVQLTAATYQRPAQLPPGHVLVVGDGATGRQVASELAATHAVTLSTGKLWQVVPQRVLGHDSMWWFDTLGALRADRATRFGRWVQAHDAIPGWHLRHAALRRQGVRIAPRTVDGRDKQVWFADGTAATGGAVLWTIGYRDETSWLHIPGAVDVQGHFVEDRGIAPVPGLFYVGRSWQNNRASALLCGVGRDAAAIVDRIRQYLRTIPRHETAQSLRAIDDLTSGAR
jgi:putative flavoprotein involved in K+ transport